MKRLNDYHNDTPGTSQNTLIEEHIEAAYDILSKICLPKLEICLEGEGEESHIEIFDADTTKLVFEIYEGNKLDYVAINPRGAKYETNLRDLMSVLTHIEGNEPLIKMVQEIKNF